MKHQDLEHLLPEYPRTRHVPHKANAKRDDLVCTLDECKAIWTQPTAVSEKIDGSQCRMTIYDGNPVIGNRNHILNKAYSKAKTASKMQFSMVFNWWYEHYSAFRYLAEAGPYSVYGDWMYMQHGMHYDRLPSLFMTYDLYDYDAHEFLESKKAYEILQECGFSTVPLLHFGPLDSFEQLEELANELSPFSSTEKREGVYLKVCDGKYVIERFKMVREGFEQGKYLDQAKITRNKVLK